MITNGPWDDPEMRTQLPWLWVKLNRSGWDYTNTWPKRRSTTLQDNVAPLIPESAQGFDVKGYASFSVIHIPMEARPSTDHMDKS
jgi:hypothetical protein